MVFSDQHDLEPLEENIIFYHPLRFLNVEQCKFGGEPTSSCNLTIKSKRMLRFH